MLLLVGLRGIHHITSVSSAVFLFVMVGRNSFFKQLIQVLFVVQVGVGITQKFNSVHHTKMKSHTLPLDSCKLSDNYELFLIRVISVNEKW